MSTAAAPPANPAANRRPAPPLQPPHTPRNAQHRSLVDIRSRILLQQRNELLISQFGHLIADLTAAREVDGRNEKEETREGRIERFRLDWMCGMLSGMRALDLPGEKDDEQRLSDDEETVFSSQETTVSSTLSFVTASEGNEARPPRRRAIPLDPVERGVLAERTIKGDLKKARVLLEQRDFPSFASVVREAMRRTRKTGRAVFVAPDYLDSLDWTSEYEAMGWAPPGVRWGLFKPDLLRFEDDRRKEAEEGDVVWEVVEVKYSLGQHDTIYTNWKVQAMFYHLSIARLLASVSHLTASHRITFFISRNPFSALYDERSFAVRTEQAFVEHHLFQLLPRWLQAVRKEEGERLREGLATPSTPAKGAPPTFLEKLQESVRTAPPSPAGRPRRHLSSTLSSSSPFTSPTQPRPPRSPLPPPQPPDAPEPPSPSASPPSSPSVRSFRPRLPSPSTFYPSIVFPPPDELPPLPPVDDEEERELQELFERIGIE